MTCSRFGRDRLGQCGRSWGLSVTVREQVDFEALSSWMDGQLGEPQASQVAQRVQADPQWRQAWRELSAVDAALDLLPSPEAGPELTERICQAVRRPSWPSRAIRLAVPLAAAACLLAAVLLGQILNRHQQPASPRQLVQTPKASPVAAPTGVEAVIDTALKDVPADERIIVRNLDMFRNYDDVSEYRKVRAIVDPATLCALEDLETQ